jgi:hypothetical protein
MKLRLVMLESKRTGQSCSKRYRKLRPLSSTWGSSWINRFRNHWYLRNNQANECASGDYWPSCLQVREVFLSSIEIKQLCNFLLIRNIGRVAQGDDSNKNYFILYFHLRHKLMMQCNWSKEEVSPPQRGSDLHSRTPLFQGCIRREKPLWLRTHNDCHSIR